MSAVLGVAWATLWFLVGVDMAVEPAASWVRSVGLLSVVFHGAWLATAAALMARDLHR